MNTKVQAFIRDRVSITSLGCWEWKGYIDYHGYAMYQRTHVYRMSYRAFKGPIPENLDVHHECKNTKCVNPNHLRAVSHKENIQMGRSCKVTMQQVEEIRERYKTGLYFQWQIAQEYGISQTQIGRIVTRKQWT